jgi:iron complex outermembrane receptor protein
MAFFFNLSPALLATSLAVSVSPCVFGQGTTARLDDVAVSGRAAPLLDAVAAEVTGFGVPLAKSPQSVTVLSADLLAATAVQTMSQAIKLDASLSDSYNTTGYIESVSVRGFLLNQSGNFSRNGLITSNDAPIALENKERLEVLKGAVGLQSGVSAPGGLVNYVTKIPMKDNFVNAALYANDSGGAKLHLDVNQKLGAIGVRLNLVDESLRPQFDKADGSRQLLSLALATDLSPATSVSANLEYHRKRQPSVPGLGLLDANGDGVGDTLPNGVNPLLNLNNQPWSQPFEASSTTAELALDHRLNADWRARVAINSQRLHIDDRLAFPDGCSNASNYVYPGLCANGDVNIYDYRSEGERRKLWSWDARMDGTFKTLGLQHATRLGVTERSASADLAPLQAYNFVGTNNIYAPVVLPDDATLSNQNTDSRERALAAYATLTSDLSQNLQSFVGARVTRLKRSSERSDGSRAVAFEQTVSTPWLGLAWSPSAGTMLYASWGQGVELEVVPNKPANFANAGQVLPALTSEQTELGLKWQLGPRLLLTAAVFDVTKPYADDLPAETSTGLPTRVAGYKTAQHRGLELSAVGRLNAALSLQASLMALDAKYTQAVDQTLVGQRVTNLPRLKASLFADYKLAALPGLSLNGLATFENGKTVTTDGSVELPSAWQLDAGLSYQQRMAGKTTLWRFNMENLTNRTYWREAPTASWGGVYLFPAMPRTLRASVTVDF